MTSKVKRLESKIIKKTLGAKNQKVKVKFEDTKGVTRSRKSKDRQYNAQKIPKG